MSIKLMTLVWSTEIPASEKLVLLALADNANDEGQCYPSVTTLMKKCSMSERGVQYAVAKLVEDGHVTREMRAGRSTIYHVHPRTGCTPAQVAPPHDMHPPPHIVHPTPAQVAPHPRTTCTHNHQVTVNEPSKEPSGLDLDAWTEWLNYRRSIKRPVKQASIPAAQKKLAAFGADQRAVVEQSIANSWQGLFPLRDQPKKNDAEQARRVMP
jgi:hypothetical protein